MIVNQQLATSTGHNQKDLWETPQWLFDELDAEFHFELDPCCEKHTRKCSWSFPYPKQNGLANDWNKATAFVNPPYSRGNIDKWVEKCYKESIKGSTVVALLPVSTSAKWFHRWVWKKAELRFLEGRIRFVGAPYTAPFSSVIAIYRPPLQLKAELI